MNAEYELEKHKHGWLLCAAPGHHGVPMNALSEILPLFPSTAVVSSGIPHHYNESGHGKRVVMAIVNTPEALKTWESEIEDSTKGMPAQVRWWLGTDVGLSSAALFHTFCDEGFKAASRDWGEHGNTPRDYADFGRCRRLLEKFPEWKERLGEMAVKHPKTAWPIIVPRWAELESSPPEAVYKILNECHELLQNQKKPPDEPAERKEESNE